MEAVYTVVVNPDLVPPELIPGLLEALSDFQPVLLDAVATYLQEQDERSFDDQGATFGDPWDALKPATVAEKLRLGYPDQPEVQRGRLAAEVGQTVVLGANAVSVGIDPDEAPYAAAQNFGDPARNLPPRVMIALTEDMEGALQQKLEEWAQSVAGVPPGAVQFLRE